MDSAREMPAYLWWDQNGGSVPELQVFARMVLAQPGSASICERINSEFEFVKDRRRNRLGHDKANLLVGLFHNLRLLKKMKQPNYSEPTIAWNDDVEKSAVTTYAAPTASATRPYLVTPAVSRITGGMGRAGSSSSPLPMVTVTATLVTDADEDD